MNERIYLLQSPETGVLPMKWKEAGAAVVFSLRTLSHSHGRWEQFCSKIDQYGFPVAA